MTIMFQLMEFLEEMHISVRNAKIYILRSFKERSKEVEIHLRNIFGWLQGKEFMNITQRAISNCGIVWINFGGVIGKITAISFKEFKTGQEF